MANVWKPLELTNNHANFRHVDLIDALTESQLREKGYYRGHPCPHGHTIRDQDHHWCYECVRKIMSNVCGFDVNYLHPEYKVKYASIWKRVPVGFPQDCWLMNVDGNRTPSRVCLPSYRSGYSKQKSENVNIHKAIYQCAWGDVGSLQVTRLCGDKRCCNPLHLVSSWNRNLPPKSISPLEIEFKAEKLMLYGKRNREQQPMEPVLKKDYKMSITDPQFVKEPPEYNEDTNIYDF